MDYITSDTHLNHKAIIDFVDRPFNTVEEMNNTIIDNWNLEVSKYDKIYHTGDFSWGNKEVITGFVDRLNGYKILIKGNHDKKSNKWYHDAGFDDVIDGGLIIRDFLFLTHKPMFLNKHMPYVNLHGHLHNNKMEGNQYYNVGVELNDYKPILIDKILEKLNLEVS